MLQSKYADEWYKSLSPHNRPTLGQGREVFVATIPTDLLDVCRCTGGDKGYRLVHNEDCFPDSSNGGRCSGSSVRCWKWVHAECGKQSFGFARECQICEEMYMVFMPPEADEDTCKFCYEQLG